MINRISGYFEEINGDKYLSITDTDKNSEVLKKYKKVWNGIKDILRK